MTASIIKLFGHCNQDCLIQHMYAVHYFCCFLVKPVFVAPDMFDRLWFFRVPNIQAGDGEGGRYL